MKKSISGISMGIITGLLMTLFMSTAVYAAQVSVTFVTPYGNYVSYVEQGHSAAYNGPVDINVTGFAFCGWDVPLNCVMQNTVATAVYMPMGDAKQSVDVCNVYHSAPTGVLSYSTAGEHSISTGTTLKTSPYPPTVMTQAKRLTAEESIRLNPVGNPGKTCVVRWYNGSNGELWFTDVIPYGGTATPPETPCIDGLEFVGWDGSWTGVTSDRNIIACFYRTYRVLYVCADCGTLFATKDLRITDDLQASARGINTEGHPYPDEWDEHWVSDYKVIMVGDPHPKHNDYYGDDDNHSHKYDYKKWVEQYR